MWDTAGSLNTISIYVSPTTAPSYGWSASVTVCIVALCSTMSLGMFISSPTYELEVPSVFLSRYVAAYSSEAVPSFSMVYSAFDADANNPSFFTEMMLPGSLDICTPIVFVLSSPCSITIEASTGTSPATLPSDKLLSFSLSSADIRPPLDSVAYLPLPYSLSPLYISLVSVIQYKAFGFFCSKA